MELRDYTRGTKYSNAPKGRIATAVGVPESDVRKLIADKRSTINDNRILNEINNQKYVPRRGKKQVFRDVFFITGNVTPYIPALLKYAPLPFIVNLPQNTDWFLVNTYRPRFVFSFQFLTEEFLDITVPTLIIDYKKPITMFHTINTPYPPLSVNLALNLIYHYNELYPFQLKVSK